MTLRLQASLRCPECGGKLNGPVRMWMGSPVFRCMNGHEVVVNGKTGEAECVVFPFKHLEWCPKCGLRLEKIVSDRGVQTDEGMERVVYYRCPSGHVVPHRQLVVKQIVKQVWRKKT